jgi:hypothetical protein
MDHVVVSVDAWGLEEHDVGPYFTPLLSLASIVRAGVDFSHSHPTGPKLTFQSGKVISLANHYTLCACMLDSKPRVPGNA